jgi:hypothetical protein
LLPAAADHPASRHRFSQRAFSIKTPRLPPRPPHLCVSLKQADFLSGKLNVFFTAIPQEGLAWSGKTGWC